MALAMVVIASMIGVGGLGQPVLKAITNQYFTMGLLNGLAIVVIAIVFDRILRPMPNAARNTWKACTVPEPLIRIANLYKIFGKAPETVMPMVRDGRSKTRHLADTGHTIGLRDINLEIEKGEVFVVMGLSGSGQVDFDPPPQPIDQTDDGLDPRGRDRRLGPRSRGA